MLWTRAVPAGLMQGSVPLVLQLSDSEDFAEVLLEAQVQANADSDYTLRAYVSGLAPDSWYYYRFLGGAGTESRIGRTRTAPAPDQAARSKLAFASCQSYEQAHYGAWARMVADDKQAAAQDQIHFVLHLGDFIYERCWHKRVDGTAQARRVPDFPDGADSEENRWAVSLADYRHLYKTYLEDPHLQEARARWPFVCTWDDHEFSNDNFQSFSTYGDRHLLQPQRKLDANQAWFEFMPAVLDELVNQPAHNFRPTTLAGDDARQNAAAANSLRIYRQLRWGKNLDIVLTDTRSYRSAPALESGLSASLGQPLDPVKLVEIADAGRTYNHGDPPATLPYGDGTTPNAARDRDPGTILGAEQRDWFIQTLADSQATWKLWGNALPLIPMRLDMSALPFVDYEDALFNLDAWAGFPHEQRLLMQALETKGVTGVVSLSGDHHMHGAGTITRSASEPDAPAVMADFTVAGISSSPIFEDLVAISRQDHPDFATLVFREEGEELEPVWNLTMTEGVLAAFAYSKSGLETVSRWLGPNDANPGLGFIDTTSNGYGLASFDGQACRVQFVGLADCTQAFKEPPAIRYRANFTLPQWQAGQSPALQGPEIDGEAPFPFTAS